MTDRDGPLNNSEDEDIPILEDDGEMPPPGVARDARVKPSWKIMLVDDDPDVHRATRLILKNVTFEDKSLTFVSAYSAAEAREAIAAHPDTAVLLLDVVMETDDAGLELIKYIRKGLKNKFVRIILKTGYPGKAPESSAIVEYDINDYKTKVEMTQQKLVATVIFALRSYRDIVQLECSFQALQDFNQNLQNLVDERTRALTEQNQKLRQEIDRRLQLERDLVESNAKFKGILDIAEEAIVSVGDDGRITLFNQGAERIFGYEAGEVLGRPLDILLPEGVRQIHRQHVRNFGADGTAATCQMKGRREVAGLRKNGEVFPAEASISRLQLQTGVIYTAILQDISDRKRVEEALKRLNQELETRVAERTCQLEEKIEQQQRVEKALRESEEKFRQFAETIREVFFMVSRTGEFLYVSPAYEEIWGRSCQEVYRDPQSWFEAVEPDHRQAVRDAFRSQIRHPQTFELEYPIARPDGGQRWIRARSFPICDDRGEIYRFAGIAENITDRKRAQDELQARETALRELYQVAVAPHLTFGRRLQALLSMGRLHFGLEVGILSNIRGDRYRVVAAQTPPDFPHPVRPDDVFPLGDTFCKDTFQTPEPVSIPDARDSEGPVHPAYRRLAVRAYLGVRILVGGEPYGTLSFSSPHPRHQPFSNHELQLLQLIAMWVGGEIERQQSKAALEREFQNTLLQQQITDEIRQSIESQHIVQATVSLVGEAFEVNRCLIYRYRGGPDSGIAIMAEYLAGGVESMLGVEVPRSGNPHAVALLAEDRAIASHDVYADPLLTPQIDLCRRTGLKSMLGIRTSYKGEPNGTLVLQQCDRFRRWTDDEIELLEAIARQVGIALAQAALLEREQWHKRQLEEKNQALEEATRRAEAANLAKSQFLANMSHEIRTPMNAILGFCDLLQGSVSEPRQRGYVRSIAASGKTLLALIDDILDLSKIEAGKMEIHDEPVDLRGLVAEICQIFSQKAAEKNLHLSADIASEVPEAIVFDEVRLRQILLNVVGNALKFTEDGSVKISVAAYPEGDDTDTVAVEIAVADTGIGIAPEQRERIFESFIQSEGQSTRKYGGSGLGLAITRRLTQMLGGTISLDSTPGRGSTFTFAFPKVGRADGGFATEISEVTDDDLNRIPQSTILAVDDVQSNLDLMRGYFARSHHCLLLAHNGLEAIQQAEVHLPDLILMDLRMPHLDGWEATKYLKDNPETRDIPIIILTASSLDRDRRDVATRHDGFLHKPISRHQLFLALEKQLSKRLPPHGDGAAATPPPPRTPPSTELLEHLQSLEETVWPELHNTLKMRDLQAFCDRLLEWARIYPHPPLVNYASTLNAQLQEFDWDKIPQTVQTFPEVRRAIVGLDK